MIITLNALHAPYTLRLDTKHRDAFVILLLWAISLACALARPIMPIDETRYVSVAWEMWHSHSFWLPLMNGEAYADKPPLLFWLIHSGWALFGVNDWWPKLISPLASLIAMVHLYRIARRLGYAGSHARLAPMVLGAMLMWNLYAGALMFDILLSACLLGTISPLISGTFDTRRAVISGLWLGLALLAKGPAVFVTLGPILLSLPLWRAVPLGKSGRRHLALALALGLAILLAWALPAAWLGGRDYAQDLLWGQSVDRLQQAMAQARPIWWYLPWIPLLTFPWLLWPGAWPRLPEHRHQRLAWIWLIVPLLVFSLISGKQIHYLMPLLPALALLVMDGLAHVAPHRRFRPRLAAAAIFLLGLIALGLVVFGAGQVIRSMASPFGTLALLALAATLWRQSWYGSAQATRGLALGTGIAILMTAQLMLAPLWSRYDISAPSKLLARLEIDGVPVAFNGGHYQATFQFAGRLKKPLITLEGGREAICRFARQTPAGWIVGRDRDLRPLITNDSAAHTFDYRGGRLDIVPVVALSSGSRAQTCG